MPGIPLFFLHVSRHVHAAVIGHLHIFQTPIVACQ